MNIKELKDRIEIARADAELEKSGKVPETAPVEHKIEYAPPNRAQRRWLAKQKRRRQ